MDLATVLKNAQAPSKIFQKRQFCRVVLTWGLNFFLDPDVRRQAETFLNQAIEAQYVRTIGVYHVASSCVTDMLLVG